MSDCTTGGASLGWCEAVAGSMPRNPEEFSPPPAGLETKAPLNIIKAGRGMIHAETTGDKAWSKVIRSPGSDLSAGTGRGSFARIVCDPRARPRAHALVCWQLFR